MAKHQSSLGKSPLKLPPQGGDLSALQRRLWFAILHCERVLDKPGNRAELRLRAAHALSQLATTYINLTKTTDFEERIARVEQAIRERRNRHHAAV